MKKAQGLKAQIFVDPLLPDFRGCGKRHDLYREERKSVPQGLKAE
jgi:hypothetical protein